MKIIDLLVKISNKEEVPYKLWYYDKANGNYKNADFENLFKVLYSKLTIYGLLSYEVEIIEEKIKEIDEWGKPALEEIRNGNLNLKEVNTYLSILANGQQELIKAVNYLLKKEDE